MWHTMNIREIQNNLKTNENIGLTEKEALKREKEYGKNKLDETKKRSIILRFLDQFKDFMIIILIIAAVVSAIISYVENTHEYMDSVIIIAIVVFNAIMGLIQESKAEKSLEALKKLSSPTTKVKRNGKIITVDSELIVPGDVIILEAGNLVSADARLTKSYNLHAEESALTGETIPVLKDAEIVLKNNIPIGDTINMVFATTIITSGHGEAIVTNTGMNTKVRKNC